MGRLNLNLGRRECPEEKGSLHHVPKKWQPVKVPRGSFSPWQNLYRPCCALPPQVYGIFYATSFLELYRSPHNTTTTSHNVTVIVQRDEQYLFLVGFLSIPTPTCTVGCGLLTEGCRHSINRCLIP